LFNLLLQNDGKKTDNDYLHDKKKAYENQGGMNWFTKNKDNYLS
jgi:hypothetical protein